MNIHTIAVLGAGTMGRGIAHTFARHGYPVHLYDPAAAVRETAMDRIRDELDFMVDEQYISPEDRARGLQNIIVYAQMDDAVKEADYVLEACPEQLELKQKLFLQLDLACRPEAILATNTSSLKLSSIMEPLPERRKKKCMVCHWYNPPHLLPIAELSKFGNMSEADFEAVYDLYTACEKKPVRVLKDVAGMIANRLLHAQAREVFHLLELGVAEKEDIDRALMYGPCFRNATTGMLEVADMGGLDVWLAGEDNLFPALDNADRASDALRDQVAQGRLGIKNGKGFFEYGDEERALIQKRFFHRLIVQLKASGQY